MTFLNRIKKAFAITLFAIRLTINVDPYRVFLLILFAGLLGTLPLVRIRATEALVQSLMSHAGILNSASSVLFIEVIRPFAAPLLLLATVIVSNSIFSSLLSYQTTVAMENVREDASHKLYHHVLNMRLEEFESITTQDMISRAKVGISLLPQFWNSTLYLVFTANISIIVIFFALFRASPILPFILLVGAIPLARAGIRSQEQFNKINYEQSPLVRQQRYYRSLLTARASATEIRLYGLQSFFLEQWRSLNDRLLNDLTDVRLKYLNSAICAQIWPNLLLTVGIVILLTQTLHHHLRVSSMVALLYGLQQYQSILRDLGWRIQVLLGLYTQIGHTALLLDRTTGSVTEDTYPFGSTNASPISFRQIVLENVSFSYPGSSHNALSSVSLQINAGDRIALVGENGAGKSTLAKLLLGLYKPSSGRILVDGKDLCEIPRENWRVSVSAVFQDFMRYPLTLRENIAIGACSEPDLVTDGEVEQAARYGGVTFLEQLTGGYQTLLGKEFENGCDLSFGQWQMLAIARCSIRNASFVVLDEPTSALDPIAEYEVYCRFRDLMQGRTMLFIAHRLSSIRLCDRVIVLRQGGVAETGTHDSLIASNGYYAEIYELQSQYYQDENQSENVTHRVL